MWRMALLAQKIGRRVIPVVEKYTELDLILKYARQVGLRPTIGYADQAVVTRFRAAGSRPGGHRSKFGLTAIEVLRAFGSAA